MLDLESTLILVVIIGIVEGLLEWIPISSEGVLLLLLMALGYSPTRALSLALLAHLGAGLACVLRFRREYVSVIVDVFKLRRTPLVDLVVFGNIVSAAVALVVLWCLTSLISEASVLCVSAFVAGCMLVLGLLMFFLMPVIERERVLKDLSLRDSLVLGTVQGLAILPGISRSGIVMFLAACRGFKSEESVDLSFLLGGVAITAAGIYSAIVSSLDIMLTLLLTSITFVTSILSQEMMLRLASLVRRGQLILAVGICILLGLALTLLASLQGAARL